MAAFVSDSMTDTAGTNLSSHTGETGATWTIRTDTGGNGAMVVSDANRLRCSTLGVNTSVTIYTPSGSPASADYSVEADFVAVTAVGITGILIRYDPATGNGYLLQYRQFFGWRLFVITGDAIVAQVGSTFATEMTAGQTTHAKVTVTGSSFTVDLTGDISQAAAITGTDSTYSAAGKPGVYGGSAETNATGVHLDNLTATDSGGGGGGAGSFVLVRSRTGFILAGKG